MAWGKAGEADGTAQIRGGRSSRSIIGSDVNLTGNLSASGDVLVEGELIGDVTCANFALGASGRIKGNVTAQHATLGGTVEGTVVATELVIEKSARVLGDVAYESISVETGARVDGRLSQKSAQPNELKLVNSGLE
ncbi:MAG: polymer-forming cytoskeletal protein [Alphaproteobacteria bacterium]|nr:polymer-forming cytoskeletal protein [Alphaproteobacteria bacterium]